MVGRWNVKNGVIVHSDFTKHIFPHRIDEIIFCW